MDNTNNTADETHTMVALDAMEAGHPAAAALLIGVPATIRIGSDCYATTIAHATQSLHTVTTACGQVFRKTAKGYRAKSYRLTIGVAEDFRDPSF